MSDNLYKCPYCNTKGFKSKRGLTSHQRSNAKCSNQILALFGDVSSGSIAHDVMQCSVAIPTRGKQNVDTTLTSNKGQLDQTMPNKCPTKDTNTTENRTVDVDGQNDTMSDGFIHYDEQDNTSDADSISTGEDDNHIRPNDIIRCDFADYVDWADKNLIDLTKEQQLAINLLYRLRKTNASLDTYESIMEWHLRSIGTLQNSQSLADCITYINREKLYKMLKKRYHLPDVHYNKEHEIALPHSRARVKIVWNDAQSVIQSLLTDPRITDDDYLFFDNDPLTAA